MTRKFTGRHMAAILVAFFAVVIAVNFTMAWFASATFGGTVVDNSYVASQQFNGWLKEARTERALGWSIDLKRAPTGGLGAALRAPEGFLAGATIVATARHPLGRQADIALSFRPLGDGRYTSNERLPAGRWIVHVEARLQGHQVNKIVDIQ